MSDTDILAILVRVRERFRQLARVHHPDGAFGDQRRMTQLNEAVGLLTRGR